MHNFILTVICSFETVPYFYRVHLVKENVFCVIIRNVAFFRLKKLLPPQLSATQMPPDPIFS